MLCFYTYILCQSSLYDHHQLHTMFLTQLSSTLLQLSSQFCCGHAPHTPTTNALKITIKHVQLLHQYTSTYTSQALPSMLSASV